MAEEAKGSGLTGLQQDPRYAWVLRQLRGHFRTTNLEFVTFPPTEEATLKDFLEGSMTRALFFSEKGAGITLMSLK